MRKQNKNRNSNPLFKVRRKRKTKNEIQIHFSMSQVDKKRKIEMGMEFHFTRPKKNENKNEIWMPFFLCHRKTVGTKVHAFWSWQSFVSSCDVLNCLFPLHLAYKMKYSCYQDCSVIHGWFVYCALCWQMHRLSKSLEIFRMASFSRILTCPCLRCKEEGRKVSSDSGTLDDLQKQHLDW